MKLGEGRTRPIHFSNWWTPGGPLLGLKSGETHGPHFCSEISHGLKMKFMDGRSDPRVPQFQTKITHIMRDMNSLLKLSLGRKGQFQKQIESDQFAFQIHEVLFVLKFFTGDQVCSEIGRNPMDRTRAHRVPATPFLF